MYVFGCMLALLISLHSLLRYNLQSLFILPVGLAALLAATVPASAAALVGLVVTSELFTTFPPGIMTAVALIPYAVRYLFPKINTAASGAFFLLMSGTIAAQLTLLSATQLFLGREATLSLQAIWYALPITGLALAFVFTTTIVFGLAVLWQERQPRADIFQRVKTPPL